MKKVKNALPNLRFPEFKDEWKNIKIGEFVEERKSYADANLPLYSLTIENGIIPKTKRYERSFLVKEGKKNYKKMRSGDFAFNPMNLRFGALAMYKGKTDIAVSKYYNVFSCNTKGVSRYLEEYFTSYKMIQFYNKMSTGTLEEKKRVHYLDFVNFKKHFPTILEQQKIAAFLSAVDKKIKKLTRKKELLELYKKGVMQKIFSQEIRFKDDDGKNFPDWEERRLGDVGELTSSKRVYSSDYVDDGIPFYRGKEITVLKENEIPDDILYISSEKYFEFKSKYGVPMVNDILITAVGTIGNVLRIRNKDPFYFKDGNLIWLRKIKELSQFLEILLNFSKKELYKTAIGSSQKALTMVELKKIKLKFPNSGEQQKIADSLSTIDKKIKAAQSQLTKTQAFKKGLLQKMFV